MPTSMLTESGTVRSALMLSSAVIDKSIDMDASADSPLVLLGGLAGKVSATRTRTSDSSDGWMSRLSTLRPSLVRPESSSAIGRRVG